MKKQVLFCLLAMQVCLWSCKRDDTASLKAPALKVTDVSRRFTTGYYVELTADPTTPGRYTAYYNDVLFAVTDLSVLQMYQNSDRSYPDGTPASGSVGIVTPPGATAQAVCTTKDSVGTGTTIVLQQTVNTLQDPTQIHDVIDEYLADFESAMSDVSIDIPSPSDYVNQDTWSVTTTGLKLIHINSGSGWAIATSDYAAPHLRYAASNVLLGTLYDSVSGITFSIYGQGSTITNIVYYATVNGVLTAINLTTFSGTFVPIDNSGGNFQVIGSLTRPNSTTYTFNALIQLS